MDTETFCGVPMTIGALKAHFAARGKTAGETDVYLEHILEPSHLDRWVEHDLPERVMAGMREAIAAGCTPVLGLSCYTWNVEIFFRSRHA